MCVIMRFFFFFKQKTAYEMRISDWSSDVCSSDLAIRREGERCRADAETASLAPDQTLTQLVFFHSSCLAPPLGLFCPLLNLPDSMSVFAHLAFLTSQSIAAFENSLLLP